MHTALLIAMVVVVVVVGRVSLSRKHFTEETFGIDKAFAGGRSSRLVLSLFIVVCSIPG